MKELRTGSSGRVQQTRTAQKHAAGFGPVAATALLGIVGGAILYAQGQTNDKYSLISPDGIAFSDFRGYEDWATVSSARTDDVQKVIVGNPAAKMEIRVEI